MSIVLADFELGEDRDAAVVSFQWMFLKWPNIVKFYGSPKPAQKKLLKTQLFYGFFENFINCSQYPSWRNVYSDLPITDIFHQLKAIHNTTKYAPYLRFNHSEKS